MYPTNVYILNRVSTLQHYSCLESHQSLTLVLQAPTRHLREKG